MTQAVKAGKARYIGISNCFAWQLCKANALAEREGFEKFISIQGHYNLIFREEEREMIPYCQEEHIAVTPYSPLAGGRLSRKPGQTTRRLEQDAYAHLKYDATQETDGQIIARVAEIAEKRGVSMAAVSLAWLLEKGAFPVTGMTKESHLQGAVQAAEMQLTSVSYTHLGVTLACGYGGEGIYFVTAQEPAKVQYLTYGGALKEIYSSEENVEDLQISYHGLMICFAQDAGAVVLDGTFGMELCIRDRSGLWRTVCGGGRFFHRRGRHRGLRL